MNDDYDDDDDEDDKGTRREDSVIFYFLSVTYDVIFFIYEKLCCNFLPHFRMWVMLSLKNTLELLQPSLMKHECGEWSSNKPYYFMLFFAVDRKLCSLFRNFILDGLASYSLWIIFFRKDCISKQLQID